VTLIKISTDLAINKYLQLLVAICAAGLLIIWPIPETIALRNSLLTIGCITSIIVIWRLRECVRSKNGIAFWILLCFYVWLIIHLSLLSQQFEFQLDELKSVWARSLMATILGFAFGIILSQNLKQNTNDVGPKLLLIFIFLGLSGTNIVCLIYYIYHLLLGGALVNNTILLPLYKAKPPFIVSIALLMPLCLILITRVIYKLEGKRWLIFSYANILISLFSLYLVNSKNGAIVFSLTFLIFTLNILFMVRTNRSKIIISIATLLILGGTTYEFLSRHIKQNPAFPSLIADAELSIDIVNQSYWKNRFAYAVPINDYGEAVNVSTYERLAWFVAGSRLLEENPQGFGLIHHSFGWMALAKWPDFYKPNGNLRGATHSGWLDMALGIGIPGILLIWIPLIISWYRSLFQKGLWFSYASWTIPIIGLTYLITEVAGTHFTEILFFMTAFFCGITLQYPAPPFKIFQ
jgi:hypothetical protein